jgi:septum formation topological specificity factor MinE
MNLGATEVHFQDYVSVVSMKKKEIMTIIYRYWNSGLVTINFRVLKKCTIEDQKVTFVMVKIKLLWPI